jgi:hypothetical protein
MSTKLINNTKAQIAATAVLVRDAKGALIEKVVEQFTQHLSHYDKKKTIRELLASESGMYGPIIYGKLEPIWSTDGLGIIEYMRNPDISNGAIKESANILREGLAKDVCPLRMNASGPVFDVCRELTTNILMVSEDMLVRAITMIHNDEWVNYFIDSTSLLSALQTVQAELEMLAIRCQRNEMASFSDLRSRYASQSPKTQADFSEYNDWLDYMTWAYVFNLTEYDSYSAVDFEDPDVIRKNTYVEGAEDFQDPDVIADGPSESSGSVGVAAAVCVGVGAVIASDASSEDNIPSEAEAGAYS